VAGNGAKGAPFRPSNGAHDAFDFVKGSRAPGEAGEPRSVEMLGLPATLG
jgi:hypothetical protein